MAENDNKKKYKDTLNLPRTTFDMRAGLVKKEPAIQQKWADQKLYEQIRRLAEQEERPRFSLHDGPPYANGSIHMGTALNKVLKDMVIRVKTMSDFDAPYLPGWDCHGLPIEQKVMDELGPKAASMDAREIRRLCTEYANRFIDVQREQFKRLGVMGMWAEPYITMNPGYEAAVLECFARLVEQDIVHKQLKPVHWSIANRTALADAELEYHDREDPSIFVALKLTGESKIVPTEGDAPKYLLVWTTTPWTLPANRAVAVHPNYQYDCVHCETADGPMTLVVAGELSQRVLGNIEQKRDGWLRSRRSIGQVWGNDLCSAGLSYEHPLMEMTCPVVAADYVTLEDGTGLVHTAPGHGMEDYGTGLKHGLEIACPVAEDGTFDETAPSWLQSMTVWDGNAKVIEYLTEQKTLLLTETISHSYPHDWRSKTPTIFRATEQWFVAVDKPLAARGVSLRELAMEACRRESEDGGIDFIPSWGRNRIAGMLESRPDWCLSRQRAWGLPIPAFYNAEGTPLLTPATVRAVARVIAEKGSDAWFHLSAEQLLAEWIPEEDDWCENPEEFPLQELTVGRDIFDVWFESGSSWLAVAVRRELVDDIPVDLYLEGSDQHRGWFQLSLLPALGAQGKPPFKAVLTHGYVVTEEGRKMSKSLGNAIEPTEQFKKRGADILRLWIASQDYQNDIRCSESLIAQQEDAYRKIRNTLRFCLGSCCDFDPSQDATEPAEHSVDLWMRLELHRLIRDVRQAYDRYEFHRAARLMYEFCTVQASSIYMSAVKDRLYCETPWAIRRRASQTVLHEVFLALVKLLAPILPHTCEEAWAEMPNRPDDEPQSVHLACLPEWDEEALRFADDLRPVNPDLGRFSFDELKAGPSVVWERLMELRQEALVKLEKLRIAGVKNPLEAEAVFRIATGNSGAVKFIDTYLKELEDLLGVGYARIEVADDVPDDSTVQVEVYDAREKYPRCARSWKRRPDVGSAPSYPDLSARDAGVMEELEGKV
ncbi:MAG: isoleucine--tRNA ligase [Phycisphaerae bacterium]